MPVKPPPRHDSKATAGRRPGRPALISRERVLTEALKIVDEHGLERLTMRRLGAELGVDPMTVYHHVADKAALFDGLVERVFSEIKLDRPTGEWSDDLRALTCAVRSTFLAHGNAVPLLGTRPPVTAPAFALIESATTILLRAGFTAQQAADAVDCVGRLVIGHTLAEVRRPPGGEVDSGEPEHLAAEQALPAERYPGLAAVRRSGTRHDPQRLFVLALDGLILGLQDQLNHNTAR
jgi:TetR/AcrR family transcriptional regulator, tetracycline repressor protein